MDFWESIIQFLLEFESEYHMKMSKEHFLGPCLRKSDTVRPNRLFKYFISNITHYFNTQSTKLFTFMVLLWFAVTCIIIYEVSHLRQLLW